MRAESYLSRVWIFSLFIASLACGPLIESQRPSYGLRKVSLRLLDDDYDRLVDKGWSKNKVFAHFKIQGKIYPIEIGYSGKTSIDSIKRNYKFTFKRGHTFQGHTHYRLSGQPSDETGLRSLAGFYSFKVFGFETPDIEPVSLYINNKYKGIYYLIEPVDEDFFRLRGIKLQSLYKAQLGNATFSLDNISQPQRGWSEKNGTSKSYEELLLLLKTLHYDKQNLADILDIQDYIRYIAAAAFIGHCDGFRNNFYIYTEHKEDKFKFIPWDLDRCVFDNIVAVNQKEQLFGNETSLSSFIFSQQTYLDKHKESMCSLISILKENNLLRDHVTKQASAIKEAFTHDSQRQIETPSFEDNYQKFLQQLDQRFQVYESHPSLLCL